MEARKINVWVKTPEHEPLSLDDIMVKQKLCEVVQSVLKKAVEVEDPKHWRVVYGKCGIDASLWALMDTVMGAEKAKGIGNGQNQI